MPNPISKFLDKLTGVDEDISYVSENYNEKDYVKIDLDDTKMTAVAKHPNDDILVTFHKLKSDTEYSHIIDVVRHNNIVILDISLMRNADFAGLKLFSAKLKQKCTEMGWDLGALSADLLMITPQHIRFEKKKKDPRN